MPLYEKYSLIDKIKHELGSCHENDLSSLPINSLIKSVLLPSTQDIHTFFNIKHCKGFDNGSYGEIIRKISIIHFKRDYKKLLVDDCWIGGSFKYSHLSLFIIIVEFLGKERLKKIISKVKSWWSS